MSAFTYLWSRAEFESHRDGGSDGLWHAASNRFRVGGVRTRDSLYVVSCFGGDLYLLGRLDVAHLLTPEEAAEHAGKDPEFFSWATDHVFTDDDAIGPMYFDLVVPPAVVTALRFEGGRPPAMREGANGPEPDPQTPHTPHVNRPSFTMFLSPQPGHRRKTNSWVNRPG
jgi:hypothetical protein